MRNLVVILVIALLLVAITFLGYLINFWPWDKLYLINAGFLVFLTILSDQINLKSREQEGRAVMIPYLVSTVLKLVFSAIFLVLLVKNNSESAKLIVFSFLSYYGALSALEIILVNRRTQSNKF